MVDTKSWFQSKTIIGCIVALVAIIAGAAGHALPDDMQSNLTDALDKIFAAVSAISTLYAAYSRLKANTKIAPTIITPAPKGP